MLLVVAAGCEGATTAAAVTSSPWVTGVGGTLTIGIDASPTGCNPHTPSGGNWADRVILEPVLPSAFVVDSNGEPVYDAAVITQAEVQSTNPQTVVYSINPKATWSDGVPITAKDFIYTWQQERGTAGPIGLLEEATGAAGPTSTTGTSAGASSATGTSGAGTSAGASSAGTGAPASTGTPDATSGTGPAMGYRQIRSVTSSDHGRTATVVFNTPYADWQSLFDELLPAHVLEKTGWQPSCTTLDPNVDLSGGPFEISRVVTGKEVVLVRNPSWWGQAPNLDRLVIRFGTSPAQLARWLTSGLIQMALPAAYSQEFLQTVAADRSLEAQSQVSTTFLQLEMSTTSTVTSSVGVRQAIAHMIDRQTLVNHVVGWADTTIVPSASHIYAQTQSGYPQPRQAPLQLATPPGSTVPTAPSVPTPSQPFPVTADPVTAAKLLFDAGYTRGVGGEWKDPGGQPLTVRMAVDAADPWATQTAQLLAAQLEAAGISVGIVDATSATAAGTDLSSGATDLALLPMHATPYTSEAIAWYTPLLGPPGHLGSQDWSNLDDPEIDSILLKASQQLNPVTAAPMYTKVDTLLWQDMAALPLFAEPSTLAWASIVGGVSLNANGASLLWEPEGWGLRVPPTSPNTAPT